MVNETTDFANSTDSSSSTFVGQLSLGLNTISGNLSGTCVENYSSFPLPNGEPLFTYPDPICNSGDYADYFSWSLPEKSYIESMKLIVTEFYSDIAMKNDGTGTMGHFDTLFNTSNNFHVNSAIRNSNGTYRYYNVDGFGGFFNKDERISLATSVNYTKNADDTVTYAQGVGNISLNYSLEMVVKEVPAPAAIWLLGSALFGLVGLRRKK